MDWKELLKEKIYTPEGSGPVVNEYDAKHIALMAYADGGMKAMDIIRKWSESDSIDPTDISLTLHKELSELYEEITGKKYEGSVATVSHLSKEG